MPTSKAARNKNKHRGSSFESFLKKQGLHEEVHAAALKRAVALNVHDLMKQTADEQERDGCAYANVARCDSPIARSRKHIGHTRDSQPGREIARAQSKDRIGGSIAVSTS